MEKSLKVLDAGYVRLVDVYGSDKRIVDAARNSYQNGTKKYNDDEVLIRYLMRKQHTSPFEFCEATYQMSMPLAISTQVLRHRTFSFNFESLRFSEAKELSYIPGDDDITLQSTENKQCGTSVKATLDNIANPDDFVDSGFGLSDFYKDFSFSNEFKTSMDISRSYYKKFIGAGIRREISRMVLPVAQYTECYAKVDLNNLMKFFKLRLHESAQLEVRLYAKAMYDLVKPLFPLTFKAFEDYQLNAETFSQTDLDVLSELVNIDLEQAKTIAKSKIKNKREREEFLKKLTRLSVKPSNNS